MMKRILLGALMLAGWSAGQVVADQYIVELTAPPAVTAAARTEKGVVAAGVDRMAAVQTQQLEVRAAVAQRSGRVLDSVQRVLNALVVEVPAGQASGLAAVPGVQAVYPVRTVRMHLERALPLHTALAGWERIGGWERAGAGVKIGILDSGIDVTHPGFTDTGLQTPSGFPKLNAEADRQFTNNKVIVARRYGADSSAMDRNGHGTAVAMAAAGNPPAAVVGFAPRAWLGNYKVFIGEGGSTTNAIILRALDDAVADGMDVVNMSFGESTAPRPAQDPMARAIENAAAAGMVVVVSAGNEGSDPNTIGSPATAASAIAVGSVRVAVGTAQVSDLPQLSAVLAGEQGSRDPIEAPLADVAALDQTGLACDPLPADSLTGRIALVFRGTCTFETKLTNVQAAGAVAALIYTHTESPGLPRGYLGMNARLPSMMLANADGEQVKARLAQGGASARLEFPFVALSSFSSRGPSADLAIKPDLLALGSQVQTAAQTQNPRGELYAAGGYQVLSGTSFSTPMVAGAAAVVKSARPGLTAQQYRSLVINSALPFGPWWPRPRVQQTGAGSLSVEDAVRNTITASPTSLALGASSGSVELHRDIELSNVGAETETVKVWIDAINGPIPVLNAETLGLAPGQKQSISFSLWATEPAGEYQGYVMLEAQPSGTRARIPYWFAVPSDAPVYITQLYVPESGGAGTTQDIYFRVTDQVGLPVLSPAPQVTVFSGGGEVLEVANIDLEVPGTWRARVRLGAASGVNVFQIQAGTAALRLVQITAMGR